MGMSSSIHSIHNQELRRRGDIRPYVDARSVGGMVPRYVKIDFPVFDGSKDPLSWLHICNQFFLNQQTHEDKVGIASFHLIGKAQLWFYKMSREEPRIPWATFKEYWNMRFSPSL